MSRLPYSVVMLLKPDGERYVFLFDEVSPVKLFQTFGEFAADPDLSFTWLDAATCAAHARKIIQDDDQAAA